MNVFPILMFVNNYAIILMERIPVRVKMVTDWLLQIIELVMVLILLI